MPPSPRVSFKQSNSNENTNETSVNERKANSQKQPINNQHPQRMANRMGMGMGPQMSYNNPMAMMGYGSMLGLGFGGYGIGMGMGMGMGTGSDSSFMKWLYVLNSSIFSIAQMGSLLVMNSHTMYSMTQTSYHFCKSLKHKINNSETTLWIRRKCKKSKVFRFILILLSIYMSSKLYELAKRFIKSEYNKTLRLTQARNIATAAVNTNTNTSQFQD